MRRSLYYGLLGLLAVCLTSFATAEDYTLNNGQTLSGKVVSPDERGVMIRLPDDSYAQVTLPDGKNVQRIPWSQFSQDALKKIMAGERRAIPYAEPWIDTVPMQRTREMAFKVRDVPRLSRPGNNSFLGGFAASSVGLTVLLLLYLGNLYAAYEIAAVRAYRWPVVCGLAAVVPVIAPVVFLCLPAHEQSAVDEQAEALAAQAAAEQAAAMQAAAEPPPAAPANSLSLAARGTAETATLPATQTFTRGQFTFNRRFFETKFASYFGVVRREADRDMLLIIKTARGQFTADRITRIAANDMHLQVRKGHVTEEVSVPFIEVQEVVLKHKDAPD